MIGVSAVGKATGADEYQLHVSQCHAGSAALVTIRTNACDVNFGLSCKSHSTSQSPQEIEVLKGLSHYSILLLESGCHRSVLVDWLGSVAFRPFYIGLHYW